MTKAKAEFTVIGARGFIGRRMVAYLAENGIRSYAKNQRQRRS